MAPAFLAFPPEIQAKIVKAYVEDIQLYLQFRVDKYNHAEGRHETDYKLYSKFICLEKPDYDTRDLRTHDFSVSQTSGLPLTSRSLRAMFLDSIASNEDSNSLFVALKCLDQTQHPSHWWDMCDLASTVSPPYRKRITQITICDSFEPAYANSSFSLADFFPKLHKVTLDCSTFRFPLRTDTTLFGPAPDQKTPTMAFFKTPAFLEAVREEAAIAFDVIARYCLSPHGCSYLVETIVALGQCTGDFIPENEWPVTRQPIKCTMTNVTLTQRKTSAKDFDMSMEFTKDFKWVQEQHRKSPGSLKLKFGR